MILGTIVGLFSFFLMPLDLTVSFSFTAKNYYGFITL
jgi:hypothetical protein